MKAYLCVVNIERLYPINARLKVKHIRKILINYLRAFRTTSPKRGFSSVAIRTNPNWDDIVVGRAVAAIISFYDLLLLIFYFQILHFLPPFFP